MLLWMFDPHFWPFMRPTLCHSVKDCDQVWVDSSVAFYWGLKRVLIIMTGTLFAILQINIFFLNALKPFSNKKKILCRRTNSLLEKVCDGVGPEHFYTCLWECLASNVGIRLPAISFVLAHFNKKLSMEDQIYIMGTNLDIMVKFCF